MTPRIDSAKLRRWREERHWSQEHLADLAGLGVRTIQRLENGEAASGESLKALAAAYQVEVAALMTNPHKDAAEAIAAKHRKGREALRLSFFIHLGGYICAAAVFIGISLGTNDGVFTMKWPLIWVTVGLVSHAATVFIVEVATRSAERLALDAGT